MEEKSIWNWLSTHPFEGAPNIVNLAFWAIAAFLGWRAGKIFDRK